MNRPLFACLLLLLPSCVIVVGDKHHSRRGSGHRNEVARGTEAFHAVEFRGAGEMRIHVGSDSQLTLSGDDDLLSEVTTEVKQGTLIIDYPDDLHFRKELKIQIDMPSLEGVDVLGSADVNIHNMQGSMLHLGISGSGNIQASGSVDRLHASISGSGELELGELATIEADVQISGSGDAEFNISKMLNYRISGSGDIEYVGDARSEGSISGSGSIDHDD